MVLPINAGFHKEGCPAEPALARRRYLHNTRQRGQGVSLNVVLGLMFLVIALLAGIFGFGGSFHGDAAWRRYSPVHDRARVAYVVSLFAGFVRRNLGAHGLQREAVIAKQGTGLVLAARSQQMSMIAALGPRAAWRRWAAHVFVKGDLSARDLAARASIRSRRARGGWR